MDARDENLSPLRRLLRRLYRESIFENLMCYGKRRSMETMASLRDFASRSGHGKHKHRADFRELSLPGGTERRVVLGAMAGEIDETKTVYRKSSPIKAHKSTEEVDLILLPGRNAPTWGLRRTTHQDGSAWDEKIEMTSAQFMNAFDALKAACKDMRRRHKGPGHYYQLFSHTNALNDIPSVKRALKNGKFRKQPQLHSQL